MTENNEYGQKKIEHLINRKLSALGGAGIPSFSSTVESAYEALTLTHVMNEYKNHYGKMSNIVYPTDGKFLNQAPGKFRKEKAFRIDFVSGESFYFACDVETYGLEAYNRSSPIGSRFEVDVVVIPTDSVADVIGHFNGYPAPQHIHSAYECKFGKYTKSQLRELLGLKRHLTWVSTRATPFNILGRPIMNSNPPIALKMVRPLNTPFLDSTTAVYYDLEQIVLR